MPIYEYKCSNCNEIVQNYQHLSEEDPVTCDSCGHDTLVKQFSAFSAQVKRSAKEITELALKMAKEDMMKLRRGDEETLHDVAGETTLAKASQTRYYDPQKAAAFKRSSGKK